MATRQCPMLDRRDRRETLREDARGLIREHWWFYHNVSDRLEGQRDLHFQTATTLELLLEEI